MSASKTQSVPQEQFLTMAANLLYKAFIESSRTRSKNIYRELATGKSVPLTTVKMDDDSTVRFDVSLDVSEYRGSVNFGAFRSSLMLLISNLGENLKQNKEIRIFSAEQNPDMMIFGVTAATQEGKEPNVMVLGANMGTSEPSVLLQLMYIDHEQFGAETPVSA